MLLWAQAPVQEKKEPAKHSPRTATLLSAVLPGAGQVYNKKNWWWKVPIIYGAGAGLIYGYTFYQEGYDAFRVAYKYRIETGATTNGEARFDKFQTPTLKLIRDSYRQARDEMAIAMVGLYALQVMDAAVEAHLLEFNVRDDLSLNIHPALVPYGNSVCAGVGMLLTIK